MLPVQECVPFAGIQVTLSVLSSTLWMPESSEAFPATVIVTVGVKTKLEFLGELMAICGGVVSGLRLHRHGDRGVVAEAAIRARHGDGIGSRDRAADRARRCVAPLERGGRADRRQAGRRGFSAQVDGATESAG